MGPKERKLSLKEDPAPVVKDLMMKDLTPMEKDQKIKKEDPERVARKVKSQPREIKKVATSQPREIKKEETPKKVVKEVTPKKVVKSQLKVEKVKSQLKVVKVKSQLKPFHKECLLLNSEEEDTEPSEHHNRTYCKTIELA